MLSELQRKHNLVLELYMNADSEEASRHYQRLSYKYYQLTGKEIADAKLSHQGTTPS